MRLIDADALMECKFKNDIGYNAFCNLVKRQETVDAVPVVRCKECRHWNGETKGCVRNPCVEPWWKNDFCSYGER